METQQIAEATKQIEMACTPQTPTLDQMVEEYVADQEGQRQTRFNVFTQCIRDGAVTVSTEEQASEIARMMNRAESDLYGAEMVAAGMIARAQARVKQLEFIFKMPLELWTSARLAGKKTRSIILPGGKLALRTVPKSTKYVDQEATTSWAQESLPAAIEMVPKLKLEVVKEWEAANEKAAPGREMTPAYDSFTVSIPKTK